MKIDNGLIIDDTTHGVMCYGYLYNFEGHGIFSPDKKVNIDLTQDQINKHNSILDQLELDAAKKYGKATFYLTRTQEPEDIAAGKKIFMYFVGTWNGAFKWNAVIKHSFHNFAGKNGRRDVWFNLDGERWHGVNIGGNDIVRARKLK